MGMDALAPELELIGNYAPNRVQKCPSGLRAAVDVFKTAEVSSADARVAHMYSVCVNAP